MHMIPIESLCQGKELLLWAKAVSRVNVKDDLCSDPGKKLASAIACTQKGYSQRLAAS